jgi:hypothetical protein
MAAIISGFMALRFSGRANVTVRTAPVVSIFTRPIVYPYPFTIEDARARKPNSAPMFRPDPKSADEAGGNQA